MREQILEDAIPIIFCSDNNYLPTLSVALQSIINHSSRDKNYEIIVIGKDLAPIYQERIESQVSGLPNFTIRFIDPSPYLEGYDLSSWFYAKRFSQAVYYRLFIPRMFAEYKKVVYIDSDILLRTDLADLYHIDIKDFWFGAVQEFTFSYMRERASSEEWVQEVLNYAEDTLKMKDERNYFNSGVLLCNIEKLIADDAFQKFMDFAPKNNKFNHDQNVLNATSEGRTLLLDRRWNLNIGIRNATRYAQFAQMNEYKNIMQNAYIIHFASSQKPWNMVDIQYASLWWATARATPFYETLLVKLTQKIAKDVSRTTGDTKPKIAKDVSRITGDTKPKIAKDVSRATGDTKPKRNALVRASLFLEKKILPLFLSPKNRASYQKNRRVFFQTTGSKPLQVYYNMLFRLTGKTHAEQANSYGESAAMKIKHANKFFKKFGLELRKTEKKAATKQPATKPVKARTIHSEEEEFVRTATGNYYLPKHAAQDKIANYIRGNRIYGKDVLDVAAQYAKEGSIIIDAGANFGQLTILMSKLVGAGGMVYSFEANEFVHKFLEKNILANTAPAKAFLGAVHNVSGETLYFPQPDFVRYSTYGSYGIDYVGKKGNPITSIALDSLDYPSPVSFMKVDVQGGDLLAMQGATGIIGKYRMPILFEYEFEYEEELNMVFQDYVDFVRSIDYYFARITAGRNYLILPKEKFPREA